MTVSKSSRMSHGPRGHASGLQSPLLSVSHFYSFFFKLRYLLYWQRRRNKGRGISEFKSDSYSGIFKIETKKRGIGISGTETRCI